MNPRFARYAAVNGRSPEEQLAHDAGQFPGGKMTGFMLWISERWVEFRAAHQLSRDAIPDHAKFDAWLGAAS